MYVDGNIHGNEIQAAETCLYLAWYITENYPRLEKVREIVDAKTFYIVPTVNPDGRAHWFGAPNTTHSSRSGKTPRDDDRDGQADEDGFDDLDGDGQITQMRRRNPNGKWRTSPEDPRLLVPVKEGEKGEFDLLGDEGIDNDGDGLINEDPPGGYDQNRNFPADWQPDYIQFGAGDFPLEWPGDAGRGGLPARDHPNVAGVQAFHNAAGMILRGPGHPDRLAQHPTSDDQIADQIGGDRGVRDAPSSIGTLVTYRDLFYHTRGRVSSTGRTSTSASSRSRTSNGITTSFSASCRRGVRSLDRGVRATEPGGAALRQR